MTNTAPPLAEAIPDLRAELDSVLDRVQDHIANGDPLDGLRLLRWLLALPKPEKSDDEDDEAKRPPLGPNDSPLQRLIREAVRAARVRNAEGQPLATWQAIANASDIRSRQTAWLRWKSEGID